MWIAAGSSRNGNVTWWRRESRGQHRQGEATELRKMPIVGNIPHPVRYRGRPQHTDNQRESREPERRTRFSNRSDIQVCSWGLLEDQDLVRLPVDLIQRKATRGYDHGSRLAARLSTGWVTNGEFFQIQRRQKAMLTGGLSRCCAGRPALPRERRRTAAWLFPASSSQLPCLFVPGRSQTRAISTAFNRRLLAPKTVPDAQQPSSSCSKLVTWPAFSYVYGLRLPDTPVLKNELISLSERLSTWASRSEQQFKM